MSTSLIITLIVVALVVVILLLLCKSFPKYSFLIITFLVIVFGGIFVGGTAYCAIQLNYYYNTEGGIYGHLQGLINNNTVEKINETKFKLSNIVMTENSDGTYSAEIYSDSVLKYKDGEIYCLYVNDIPDTPIDSSSKYVLTNYEYVFYNDDMTIACEDTLNINVSFYDTGSYLKVSTSGGQTAVNYWSNYFNKNNFVVEVRELPFEINDKIETTEGEVNNTEIHTVTYYVQHNVYDTKLIEDNTLIEFPTTPTRSDTFISGGKTYGYKFDYWVDSEGNEVTAETLVTSDMQLTAVFKEVVKIGNIATEF